MVKVKSKSVAHGFKKREKVDFSETFTPTVSGSCVRLLSAICVCGCNLDIICAILM